MKMDASAEMSENDNIPSLKSKLLKSKLLKSEKVSQSNFIYDNDIDDNVDDDYNDFYCPRLRGGFKKMIKGYKYLNKNTMKYTYLMILLGLGYQFFSNRALSNQVNEL